jgi:F0F1-type ATP synthase assembly protein I
MTTDDETKTPPSPSKGSIPQWAAFTTMGISSGVLVAIGVVLGIWADSALHTSPILLFVGLILGCVVAVLSAIAQIRKFL